MSNPFLRAYEFEKRFGLDRLRLTLEKAEQAYRLHQPETIDFCKSALECICKSIIAEKQGIAEAGIEELPKLIKSTLRALGHINTQIGGGITSLVQGVAELRNDHTVAGHGLSEATRMLSKAEIDIFVKTFSHIVDVLLTLLDKDKVDIAATKMSFTAIEELYELVEINRGIDEDVSVEYVKEDGRIYVEGKEIRPSELLYLFDRKAYLQLLERERERQSQMLESDFREKIEEQLNTIFEGFSPSHYVIDELIIFLDEINIENSVAKIKGRVSTSVRLGNAREEDGIDKDYASEFTAELKRTGSDSSSYELVELKLEVIDCVQPDEANPESLATGTD